MSTELYLVVVIVLVGAAYFILAPVIGAYLQFRGSRVVICPETRRPAAVEVNARHAALTAALGQPRLRLSSCSRWPERADCGQECILQIELAPEDCLARTMLTRWYEGKSCAFCGKPFGEIHWADHKPALLNLDGKTLEWAAVAPEQIPDVLLTHAPVCWNCHIAESFRREHPELVIDRPRLARPGDRANPV